VEVPSGTDLFTGRAEPLDSASILIQADVGLFKQTIDDINDAPPIGVDGVKVWQSRTYNFRIRSRIAQKAFRKPKK